MPVFFIKRTQTEPIKGISNELIGIGYTLTVV